MLCGIYLRLSKDEELVKNNSLENQLFEATQFCKENGLEYKTYDEGAGFSGTLGKDIRVELGKLLEDCQNGVLTHVYIRDFDRLSRREVQHFEYLALFEKHNIKLYIDGNLHDYDLDALPSGVMALYNAHKTRNQSRKTKKALMNRALQNKTTGISTYGYTSDDSGTIIVHNSESLVVKRIYNDYKNGESIHSIAVKLDAEKVPSRRNVGDDKKYNWRDSSVNLILKNPYYTGKRIFQNKIYPVPIIIDAEMFDDVQTLLVKNNKTRTGKRVSNKYLLKEVCDIRCEKCGEKFSPRTRAKNIKNGKPFYCCSSRRFKKGAVCNNTIIDVDTLESLVCDMIFNDPRFIDKINEIRQPKDDNFDILKLEQEKLKKEINSLENQNKKLLKLYAKEIFTIEELETEKKKNDNKINSLTRSIRNVNEQLVLSENRDEIADEMISYLTWVHNGDIKKAQDDIDDMSEEEISFIRKKEGLKKFVGGVRINTDEKKETVFVSVDFKNNLSSSGVLFDKKTKKRLPMLGY